MFERYKNRKNAKRSPLKAPPLRYAGQSVDEQIQKIIEDKIANLAVMGSVPFGFALYEWITWYFKMPPQPMVFTVIAIILAGYSLIRIRSYKRQIKNLRQASQGEKAVGQYLEALMEKGYRIFHDVIGNGFNIDHVVVGSTGIFSVETKTISKPMKGQCEISYDGEKIVINGMAPDRDPIIQAKAQANWLRDFIEQAIGKNMKVRPVVLYPGWFIERQPKGVEVWVLNPRNFPTFLEYEKTVLNQDEIKLIASQLSQYIRRSSPEN